MRTNCGLTIKLVGAKESMLLMGVFRTSISRKFFCMPSSDIANCNQYPFQNLSVQGFVCKELFSFHVCIVIEPRSSHLYIDTNPNS